MDNDRKEKSQSFEAKLKYKKKICKNCEIEVIFNIEIHKLTGLCGACATGEARLNYEEE